MPSERVVVFIDGSNLYHSLKNELGKTNLDFEKMCARLVGQRDLVRIYYYNAPVDQTKEPQRYKDQQRFFEALKRIPYFEVRLGRLVYRNLSNEPPYEKGVDVKMATDMLVYSFRGNYDTLVLVSGDTDFADAVQAIKDMGKHVEVALFGRGHTSQRLREVADKVLTIDNAFLADSWT